MRPLLLPRWIALFLLGLALTAIATEVDPTYLDEMVIATRRAQSREDSPWHRDFSSEPWAFPQW